MQRAPEPEPRSLPARVTREAAVAHGGTGLRTFLAVFVAQGAWWLVMVLAVIGTLAFTWTSSGVGEHSGIVDWLVDSADDVAGSSTEVIRATLIALSTIGALLLVGVLVVPMLIQVFVRIVCGASVGYAWALVANLASSIGLVALTLLLWFIPGAQPVAMFACWLGSSALTSVLVQLRMRPIEPLVSTTTHEGIHPP